MPKGLHRKVVPLLLAALVFALTLGVVSQAFAGLDDPLSGTSTTNPNAGDALWRQGWGNSLFPQYELVTPIDWYGYLYTVDRSAVSAIVTTTPEAYERMVRGSGTHVNNTLDLAGFYSLDPVGGNGLTLFPGAASSPLEGKWYLHTAAFSVNGDTLEHTYGTVTQHLMFGYDATAPSKVTGVALKSGASGSTLPTVIATNRVYVRWDYVDYDKLAGTAFFNVYVDSLRSIPTTTDPMESEQGAPWYGIGGTGGVSLEDLAPGRHTIQVSATDRATNEGPRSDAAVVWVDPDAPKITITAPSSSLVGKSAAITATATDAGGVSSVVFKIDGTVIATDASAPYEVTANMVPFGSGTHTITATVTDMYGRTATATKTVTADVTNPSLSSVSGGPSPFYPKKRNGYRDDYVVKFTASESSVATLIFKTSKGTTFKTITKSVPRGATSIKWNGKSGGGNFKEGTYSWTLKLTDAAGNVSTVRSGKATERFYQLVKTSRNKVKLVLR